MMYDPRTCVGVVLMPQYMRQQSGVLDLNLLKHQDCSSIDCRNSFS